MAFLTRQISHSAEGREIVRSARIDDDLIRIGRDPSCDIKLTDLAVALQHAVIERISGGQLGVSASTGLRVELNGSSVPFGRIDLAQGGEIRIASHLIRVMPTPAGADDVELVLERVTEGEGKLDAADDARFSLVSVMPSKRVQAWAVVVAVLLAFLAWPIKSAFDQRQAQAAQAASPPAAIPASAQKFHADSMWSSGKLSQAHASLENNCVACHATPFVAVRDESCRDCHVSIHDHADPFRMARAQPDLSTWGRVQLAVKETFNLPPGRCVDCHKEHEGNQVMPVTEQRFCSDCHGGLDKKLPDTKLGNADDFGKTHPEFQPAVITRWNGDQPVLQRMSLAAKPKEMSNLKFPHDLHLSKTNGVAQMARRLGSRFGFGQAMECKDCHVATPDGVRFQPVDMENDCQMCHSLAFDRQGSTLRTLRHGDPAQVVADMRDFYRARVPNPPATLGGMSRRLPGETVDVRNRRQFQIANAAPGRAERAIRAVFSPGGACYDCHVVQAPPPGSLNYEIRPVAFPIRFMNHGWFDHKAHANETCTSCHKAESSASATDLMLPDLASCRTCHGGESSKADVPSSCAMCHDYHMDTGTPSMLIRQQVRGKRQDTTARVEPARTAAR